MKCENCKKELANEKEFNGLICKPIEQFNTAFKDIKIPKGWRLVTMKEGIDLLNNDEFVKWSKFKDNEHDFFCKQPFKNNPCGAGFYYDSGVFLVSGNMYNQGRSRGVLLVKSRDKDEKN